jgi:hypothetical protein
MAGKRDDEGGLLKEGGYPVAHYFNKNKHRILFGMIVVVVFAGVYNYFN